MLSTSSSIRRIVPLLAASSTHVSSPRIRLQLHPARCVDSLPLVDHSFTRWPRSDGFVSPRMCSCGKAGHRGDAVHPSPLRRASTTAPAAGLAMPPALGPAVAKELRRSPAPSRRRSPRIGTDPSACPGCTRRACRNASVPLMKVTAEEERPCSPASHDLSAPIPFWTVMLVAPENDRTLMLPPQSPPGSPSSR